MEWETLEDLTGHVANAIGAQPYRWFDYVVPEDLQHSTISRLRKDYPAKLAYLDTAPGGGSDQVILCLGGIVNSARRFDFLAADMRATHRVIAVDWPGRGRSGWLAQQTHYTNGILAHAVESLIEGLGLTHISLLGSSLGGKIGMDIAAHRPALVGRLILNDIGPEIPARRRVRRAETIGSYHVCARPVDLFRCGEAAQRHTGPIGDAVCLHNIMGQTKPCQAGGGREYRHDPRASQAYAEQERRNLPQWDVFKALECQTLLLHGDESDALLPETVRRMQDIAGLRMTVVHVPETGHSPALADADSSSVIGAWLSGHALPRESTLPCRAAPVRLLFTDGPPTPQVATEPRQKVTALSVPAPQPATVFLQF
ncbi:alpha/beta hydrolase [Telmatospirillum sp.]|uniref:alpha/beta fold hydrolase n=1 Tax=Telmatospirillum sp. TaxID=2079197 RepID=UPI002845BEC4|nr:alpha/beta hydrolase [Telmatospirillum sp.]MDR3437249.1 alpha/beta hydrolase [Telmatospirillum sp.]